MVKLRVCEWKIDEKHVRREMNLFSAESATPVATVAGPSIRGAYTPELINPTTVAIYYVLLPLRYLAVWLFRQPASSGSTVLA